MAAIGRNCSGRVIAGCLTRHSTLSALVGEASAIQLALICAIEEGLLNVEIKSDSRNAIQVIRGEIPIPWEIKAIVSNIKHLHQRLELCSFKWIPQQANSVANWLAIHHRKGLCPMDWGSSILCNEFSSV